METKYEKTEKRLKAINDEKFDKLQAALSMTEQSIINLFERLLVQTDSVQTQAE